ncbi:MAG: S1C family serine protease, partial [Nitrososphaerales archaeon]
PSVVQIKAGDRGLGSGVVWNRDGLVLTNSHVIGRTGEVEVTLYGDSKSYKASVQGQDRFSDVALLKIEDAGKSLHPIEQGDSSNLAVGQFILALANPFGEKVGATFGIITNASATMGGRMPWADNVIVTDAKLNPGYSGGPLIDASGKMIGMNAAYFANRGIAIPINTLADIAKNLASEGSVKRAYLGIVSDALELPQELAEEIQQEEGLIVLSVESGTPAKRAGVAVGDIVVKLDSKPVRNFYDLRKILTSKTIGKPTSLSVLRGEKLTELTVTPTEARR